MTLPEIFLIGVGLSMDAFAVSICKGLCMKKFNIKNALIIALYFGFFQALMPTIGYFAGSAFAKFVQSVDHWIAFGLLSLIGINMIRESFETKENEEKNENDDVSFRTMILLAIATSIDALAVGVTFAFEKINLPLSVTVIGCTTFLISFAGVKTGQVFGSRFSKKAQIAGGIILILIGLHILMKDLGIISF